MNNYSADSKDRSNFHWIAIVMAIGGGYLFHIAIDMSSASIPWWLETPSILGIYGVINWAYSSFIWKTSLWGFKFSSIPNCQGTWKGTISSSYSNKKIPCIIVIRQTWRKILVSLYTNTSTSHSTVATITGCRENNPTLIYEYQNMPSNSAPESMSGHFGMVHLPLSPSGCRNLQGEYYTGKGRQTYGSIILSLIETKVLSAADAMTILNNSSTL